MGIYDLSTTAADNTTVGGVSVAEGWSPALVNNAIRGLSADLKKWANDIGGAKVAGGSANVLTLSTDSGLTNYSDGYMLAFVAAATNTGAATLSVDGVGAKAIRKGGDTALVGGEIVAGGHYLVQYDASANSAAGAWLLINPTIIYTASIAALDGLTPAADRVPYYTGATTAALATFTSFGRSLVDDADAATARATLGLGTIATQAADSVNIDGGAIDGTAIGASTPGTGAFTTLTASGTASFADGSASTPSIANTGDANTGLFFPAADTIGLAVGGSEMVRADTDGLYVGSTGGDYGNAWRGIFRRDQDAPMLLGLINGASGASVSVESRMITGTGNSFFLTQLIDNSGAPYLIYSAGTALTDVRWLIGGSERMRIDSSGNVGIGKTASEKLDVNGTVNATGFKLGGTALPITQEFVSSEQTITSAGALTIAHGLGVVPKIVQVHLICLVAENGYAVGDVVPVNNLINTPWNDAQRGQSIRLDDTNITIRFGANARVYTTINAATGALVDLTNANWRMIVRAYA